MQPESLTRLAAAFRRLPAVGQKTAMRYAYALINMPNADAEEFLDAIAAAREKVHFCPVCGDYTEGEGVCARCAKDDADTLCVVAQPKDIPAIEKMGGYGGAYHVLHGTLDFQKGVGADQLRIPQLLARLQSGKIKEVILATDSHVSGEMTANYLANLLRPLGITVSRLAHGISMGSEIEYTDELTMQRAFLDRKPI